MVALPCSVLCPEFDFQMSRVLLAVIPRWKPRLDSKVAIATSSATYEFEECLAVSSTACPSSELSGYESYYGRYELVKLSEVLA